MSTHTPQPDPLLTPAEVAAMFRVDPKTVTRWAKAGKLTSIRTLGGHRRYRESEVRALLEDIQEHTPDPMAAPVHSLWPRDGMPRAVRNRLSVARLATVGKLTSQDAGDLRVIGLGSEQVDQVRLALARKGFTLRGEVLDKAPSAA
jgi:excisionase family DNA binding protein